jgi:hypothetical protein
MRIISVRRPPEGKRYMNEDDKSRTPDEENLQGTEEEMR